MSTVGKSVQVISKVSRAAALALDGFDVLALADRVIDPNSNYIAELNAKAHSNSGYNLTQVGVNAVAAFTSWMTQTIGSRPAKDQPASLKFDDSVPIVRDSYSTERYWVPGEHYDEFADFWENGGYKYTPADHPQTAYIKASEIEGVFINNSEVANPSVFWDKNYSKSEYIDFVANGGINSNPIEVTRVNDSFYYFHGDGRHRILVARELGLDIPVIIQGVYQK